MAHRSMKPWNTVSHQPSTKSKLSWKLASVRLMGKKYKLKCFLDITNSISWLWASVVPHLLILVFGAQFTSSTDGNPPSPLSTVEMKRTLAHIKSMLAQKKFSVIHQPLFNIELDHVILDELHLMMSHRPASRKPTY